MKSKRLIAVLRPNTKESYDSKFNCQEEGLKYLIQDTATDTVSVYTRPEVLEMHLKETIDKIYRHHKEDLDIWSTVPVLSFSSLFKDNVVELFKEGGLDGALKAWNEPNCNLEDFGTENLKKLLYKFRWKCPICGEEFRETIPNMYKGVACQNCGYHFGKEEPHDKAPGIKSVVDVRPDLLENYDPAKNNGIQLDWVDSESKIPLNWHCTECGHTWQRSAYSIASGVTGCPNCGAKKKYKTIKPAESGKIKDVYPQILEEFDSDLNERVQGLTSEDFGEYDVSVPVYGYFKCSCCGNPIRNVLSLKNRIRALNRACAYCGYIAGENEPSFRPGKKNVIRRYYPFLIKEIKNYPSAGFGRKDSFGESDLEEEFKSERKLKWACRNCGNEHEESLRDRIVYKLPCESCGYNIFDSKYAKIALDVLGEPPWLACEIDKMLEESPDFEEMLDIVESEQGEQGVTELDDTILFERCHSIEEVNK